MLKANQLFSDDRNDSILMILISNDQPHVPAAPINIRQRRSVVILGRAAVNWRSVLWISCPIRLCAQLPGSNGFYCAQEASGYDSKPVDQSIEAKFYPINCWNNSHWMISCWKRLVTFGRKVASLLAQFSQPTEAVSSARDGDSPSVVQ